MTHPVASARGLSSQALARRVIEELTRRGETIAVAESLTGGLVCAALTDVPGASVVVRGAVVSYATDLKASALGVDAGLLGREGPVHPAVAEQMAAGAARWAGADWGVATTGVAGPGPADGHPEGTVFVGVARAGAGEAPGQRAGEAAEQPAGEQSAVHRAFHFPGDRDAVRGASVEGALQEILRQLDFTEPLGDTTH
ncbi:CinA family protein [Kytococcus sedentarius]|uniref:CinA family protein n=1 Tax=Kytococcus sedentarius TaxID=1276 RepID=UPI0035BC62EF